MFLCTHAIHEPKKRALVLMGVFALLAFFFIFIPDISFAQDIFGVEPVGENIQLAGTDIRLVIANIIRAILGLLGIIAVIIVLYGGFVWMTSAGNEERIATAKKILINGAIGLAIILSAFTIVQFVINSLTDALSGGDATTGGGVPVFDTFAGSGSLGRIIEDHYPFRDQIEVPRNTKIVVTFAEAIDPASLIVDYNNSGTLGDCVGQGTALIVPVTDCDRLIATSAEIYRSDEADATDKVLIPTIAQILLEANGSVRTFIFRPIDPLGSSVEPVWYTVDLLDAITKADGETGAFDGQRSDHYAWEFQTGTSFDFTPPTVTYVYPESGGSVPRNSIVQINFSEAVDPITVQGLAGPTSPFTHIIFGDATITGAWQITNGYTTVEFVSDSVCGQNSCGEPMFCLPVACAPGDENCSTNHEILIRAGTLENPQSDTPFLAMLFSGVMDMAGNALDNGPNNVPDGLAAPTSQPAPGQEHTISAAERVPDNYTWQFSVENTIDRTAPYVRLVTPGIDQQAVIGNAVLELTFSTLMSNTSLRNSIELVEYPANVGGLDDIWFRVIAGTDASGEQAVTRAIVDHRTFGPNNLDLYYYPTTQGTVKSLNQNCLYPGRGPDSVTPNIGSSPLCTVQYDENGVVQSSLNCVDVSIDATTDTGCVHTNALSGQKTQPNIASCLDVLEANSPTTL